MTKGKKAWSRLRSATTAMSDWGPVGLYLYCLLLATLAVLFSAAFATFPHWLWPAS